MNNQSASTNFAAALGTAALILTSLAAAPRAAAQSIGNDWEQYGQMLVLDRTITTPAMQALGATIHSQKLSNPVRITFYKAKTASTDGFEYYLVTGNSSHGVKTFQTAGGGMVKAWYGDRMNLILSGRSATGAAADLLKAEPSTTQLITTEGVNFSIGMQANGPQGSFGYSNTVTAPDVLMGVIVDSSSVTYNMELPGVTIKRMTPHGTSKDGMNGFEFASLYRVPQGAGFSLGIAESMKWDMFASFRVIASEMSMFIHNVTVDFTARQLRDELGRCLTVQGAQAVMAPCESNSVLQRWSYTAASQVKNEATSTCLDFQGTAAVESPVFTTACSNDVNQKWALRTTGGTLLLNKLRSISGFVAAPAELGRSATTVSALKLAPESTNTMITVR